MKNKLLLFLLNVLDFSELVEVWNRCCQYWCEDDIIYVNDEDGFKNAFKCYADLARAIYYGEFNYNDDYFYLNGRGNIETFSKELPDRLDLEELVDNYLLEHYKEVFDNLGIMFNPDDDD